MNTMTNFIIIGVAFIVGFILAIAAIILLGLYMDRSEAKRIRKEIGEDFEICVIPKSKLNEVNTKMNN